MKMHFNYKDLFKAPRIAFSFQRIWINGIGLLAGYLVYLIFTYVSLIVSGYNFADMWSRFGLLPCSMVVAMPWYGWVLYVIGMVALLAVVLLTNTAVSRIVYMVLRDELFYTWTQAYKFAFKKWISVLGSMITFIFMIAFFAIGALIMGLLGRIPIVGELGTFLLTIPYMLAALLLFFIGIVFVIGIYFVPAIIATSDEDALGGVFQSFSMTFNQPARLIGYTALTGVLYFLGIFILAVAVKYAYLIFAGLFSVGMGDKFADITTQGLHLVDQALAPLYSAIHNNLGEYGNWIYLSRHHSAIPLSTVPLVSAYMFAGFMILVGGAVIAFGEALGNAGLTIIYIVLYKLHEKENLLEREDEELKEEEKEIPKTEEKESVEASTEEKAETKKPAKGKKKESKGTNKD